MSSRPRGLVLTESQAGCLDALRQHKESKTDIAIDAKLDFKRIAAALDGLESLGLAERGEKHRWHITRRGKTCRFNTVPDRVRRGRLGTGGGRLLDALERPMRGRELAQKLGLSKQRIHQLVVDLHAQGRVRLGDRERILLIVARASDKTILLSHAEERVLSAVPHEYATSATKIRLAARRPENLVRPILQRFVANGFVEVLKGLAGDTVYRITAAGLRHPQHVQRACHAEAPRLPVESDRVRAVLSAVLDAGPLRIRDVRDMLKIQHDSINALMQYLKRKALVQKAGRELNSPYSLTDKGQEALAEMTRRRAA